MACAGLLVPQDSRETYVCPSAHPQKPQTTGHWSRHFLTELVFPTCIVRSYASISLRVCACSCTAHPRLLEIGQKEGATGVALPTRPWAPQAERILTRTAAPSNLDGTFARLRLQRSQPDAICNEHWGLASGSCADGNDHYTVTLERSSSRRFRRRRACDHYRKANWVLAVLVNFLDFAL